MYAEAQAKQQRRQRPAAQAAGGRQAPRQDDGNVVDAEYKEVKDKKSA